MKKKAVSVLLAVVLCFTLLPTAAGAAARDTSAEDALAADLKQLGLFQGVSDTDFDLGRTPNRTEALVMLIRFLGKEAEALEGRWTHPFTDVPAWADSYVGYAYEHIPDFGEFSQAELVSITYMPLGYYIEYDAYDFYDLLDDTGADLLDLTLRIYQSALLKKGFVPDETADGLFGWYTTPTEAVYLDADPLGTGLITVVAVRVPQYYAEVPQLPDYGWFVGVESGAATPSKGSLLYVYKWIDIFDSSDDFEYSLSQYFELLTDDGFVPVYSDSTSALFEGNGLSVVYTLDGTLLWVDVAPL